MDNVESTARPNVSQSEPPSESSAGTGLQARSVHPASSGNARVTQGDSEAGGVSLASRELSHAGPTPGQPVGTGEAGLPSLEAASAVWEDTWDQASSNGSVASRPATSSSGDAANADGAANADDTSEANLTKAEVGKNKRIKIKLGVAQLLARKLATTPESINKAIDERSSTLEKAVRGTSRAQGLKAYAASFGAFGIAARLSSTLAGGREGAGKADAGLIGNLGALTMPASHGLAGVVSKPGDNSTQLVAHRDADTRALPNNAIGRAFDRFRRGLGVENTIVQGAMEAIKATAKALGGGGAKLDLGVKVATDLALAVPGSLSAMGTLSNVNGMRGDAGFSIQQPITNSSGKQVGILVTHQELKDAAHIPGQPEGSEHQKLGTITADQDGNVLTALIVKDNDDKVSLASVKSEPKPEAKSTGQSIVDTASAMLSATFTKVTAKKVLALGAALAHAALIKQSLPALQQHMIDGDVDPETAEVLLKLAGDQITNTLLGLQFIPNFQTTTDPTVTNLETALSTLVPGFGGGYAMNGNTSASEIKELSKDTVSGLAARQTEMFVGLAEEEYTSRTDTATSSILAGAGPGDYSLNGDTIAAFVASKLPAANSDSNV